MSDSIAWTETEPGFWESDAIRETEHTAEYFIARVRRIGGRRFINETDQYEFAIDYFPNDVDPPFENIVIGTTAVDLEIAQAVAAAAVTGLFPHP